MLLCGSDFCQTCDDHAHENGVHAWADGHVHDRPKFGDADQKRVATAERKALVRKLMAEQSDRITEFPEVTNTLGNGGTYAFAVAMERSFWEFFSAGYVAPVYFGRGNRPKRRKDLKAHRVAFIMQTVEKHPFSSARRFYDIICGDRPAHPFQSLIKLAA